MGFWSTTRNVAGHVINVRVDKWLGYDYLKRTTKSTYTSAKELFTPAQAEREESFKEAMQRLNITEEDLKQREKEFFRLFVVYLIFATAIFFYGVFIALNGNLMGFVISFCLTLYALSHAFRHHFWMFQIKNRKLGCSLQDWFRGEEHK